MLPLLSVLTAAADRVAAPVVAGWIPLVEFCLEDGACCLCFCKWFLKMSSEHLSAN